MNLETKVFYSPLAQASGITEGEGDEMDRISNYHYI